MISSRERREGRGADERCDDGSEWRGLRDHATDAKAIVSQLLQ